MPNWLTTEIVIAGKDAKRFKNDLVKAINTPSDLSNAWNFVKIDDKYFNGCKLVDKTYTKDTIEYTLSEHGHSKNENINYVTQNFSSKPIEGCEWIFHIYRILDGTYKTDKDLQSYIHNGFENEKGFKSPIYGRGSVIQESISFDEKKNELKFSTLTTVDNSYYLFKRIIEKNNLEVTICAFEYEILNAEYYIFGETASKYFPYRYILEVQGSECSIQPYEDLDNVIKVLNNIFLENHFNKALSREDSLENVFKAIQEYDNFITSDSNFSAEKSITYLDLSAVETY